MQKEFFFLNKRLKDKKDEAVSRELSSRPELDSESRGIP